ncbi:MAG: anthranilate synthase component I family protein [Pseudobutyrivibrio sp.]|nr:anthranilate synthase component I family protein [Pseudobutyrivibrio sp.]
MHNTYPQLQQVKSIADTGQYKRIPVMTEILSDSITPIELVKVLRHSSHHCFLLESASQNKTWGRYTFLGYEPELEVSCVDTNPRARLKEILANYKSPKLEDFPPFTGGLVGYFSYDYIKYTEPKLKLENHGDDDFKDMDLMLFNDVICFDNFRQKIYIITGIMLEEGDLEGQYKKALKRLQEIIYLIKYGEKKQFEPLQLLSEITPKFTNEQYGKMVEKAKNYIKEGDIFQVVLSNPLSAKAEGSLFDVYRFLRATNPSPYMFYFSSSDIEMAGASPESLVKLEDKCVSTFPLAGTRPRGATAEEDEALKAELLSDEKEKAEHNMLVDLGRNDIGKIAKLGTVAVEKYMEIESFSHVMHIGSTVVGQLDDTKDAVDAIEAILPAGTLSGAPKFRACEIIEELEQSRRGVYGGAVGYIDFAGNMDVCIAIRLVYKKKDSICIRSGAGIVYDSVPEKEAVECINKAKAVVNAVMAAEGGLE